MWHFLTGNNFLKKPHMTTCKDIIWYLLIRNSFLHYQLRWYHPNNSVIYFCLSLHQQWHVTWLTFVYRLLPLAVSHIRRKTVPNNFIPLICQYNLALVRWTCWLFIAASINQKIGDLSLSKCWWHPSTTLTSLYATGKVIKIFLLVDL